MILQHDLFPPDPAANRLPCGGLVQYFGPVLPRRQEQGAGRSVDEWLETLLETIPWQPDRLILFGRAVTTSREVAWYGDAGCSYRYSGVTRHPLVWNAPLRELKGIVEGLTGSVFNSCLLNLYHHGGEGMGWHSDNEKCLGPEPVIASLSLGAERRFSFRHRRTGETVSLNLAPGSLLVMRGGDTQTHWQHSLPKAAAVAGPRVNLTFRRIVAPEAEGGSDG